PADLVIDRLDRGLDARKAVPGLAIEAHLPTLAARGALQNHDFTDLARTALEVQAESVSAQGKPGVGRDGTHVLVGLESERIEASCALLNLGQRERAGL